MTSVLMFLGYLFYVSPRTAQFLLNPSLSAVLSNFLKKINPIQQSCGRVRKVPLYPKAKNRCQNASLTAEAALVFPVFFFCMLYLLWMFLVLMAEVEIARAGIVSCREAAAFSYVADRLETDECKAPEKITRIFGESIVRDASALALFYLNCDRDLLKSAHVAQGVSGLWMESEPREDGFCFQIHYRVSSFGGLLDKKDTFHSCDLVYRSWTGTKMAVNTQDVVPEKEMVYMVPNGEVYHLYKNCSHIDRTVLELKSGDLRYGRNQAGAVYRSCEYCKPDANELDRVYVTNYGSRYHATSSCPSLERNPSPVELSKVKDKYRVCKVCAARQEENEE